MAESTSADDLQKFRVQTTLQDIYRVRQHLEQLYITLEQETLEQEILTMTLSEEVTISMELCTMELCTVIITSVNNILYVEVKIENAKVPIVWNEDLYLWEPANITQKSVDAVKFLNSIWCNIRYALTTYALST